MHNYYAETVIEAFKQNKPLDEAQKYLSWKKKLSHDNDYKPIRELFKGQLLERFFYYISLPNVKAFLDSVEYF